MLADPKNRTSVITADQLWRDLSYDIGWEASGSGIIRCRTVHNRRNDIFKAVDGVDLRTVWCESSHKSAFELLDEKQGFRHVEIRLPAMFGPERLYLTARCLPDGGSTGTICAVDPRGDEVIKSQLALLRHITQTRAREEDYRIEAETMLRGLQILLSPATTSQKLETLIGLAVDAIRGGMHIAMEIQRDGRVRPLKAGTPALAKAQMLTLLCRQQQTPVSIHKEGEPHTAELRKLLEAGRCDVALMLLPVASSDIALLCAPRRDSGFRPEDVGLANRFALIVQQALVLKDEQDKLIQAARLSALGQMSASLAHELRQPLNAISMVAQNLELMIERGPVAPDTLSTKVSRIAEQVLRASKIMDRIRRFSRKNTEALALVDIAQLVEGVRLLMEHDLIAAGIRLELDIRQDIAVRCDAVQIEQVLTNLIRNAMDALLGIGTAEKTANGTIAIRACETEDGIALRVEDNGPGFPDDVACRQLETFYTSKSSEFGTGLGLSVCHMIAREHAGSLEVGNHDSGAFVELRLPKRSDAE